MATPDLGMTTILRAHPHLREHVTSVREGDWTPLRAAIEATTNSSDRTFLRRFAADLPGISACVDPVAHDDPLAGAIMADLEIQAAWEIRTAKRADQVSAEQFAAFRRGLVDAERRLTRLVARFPDHADAAAVRLTTMRGLQLGRSEASRRWKRYAAMAPDDVWAHRQMVQYWAPKWFGSWDLMFDFVRASTADAPAGSPLHALMVDAHLERWLDQDGAAASDAYLAQHDVAKDLMDAAANGPLHPRAIKHYGWATLENGFAMIFSMAEARAQARHHFQRLDGLVSQSPWDYLTGDVRANFEAHEAAANPGLRP